MKAVAAARSRLPTTRAISGTADEAAEPSKPARSGQAGMITAAVPESHGATSSRYVNGAFASPSRSSIQLEKPLPSTRFGSSAGHRASSDFRLARWSPGSDVSTSA